MGIYEELGWQKHTHIYIYLGGRKLNNFWSEPKTCERPKTRDMANLKTIGNLSHCDMLPLLKQNCHVEAGFHHISMFL
jgi:hypothetical protein